jgi:CelD/BcsL family acetyltransferase involved in cellulose biosynthesis
MKSITLESLEDFQEHREAWEGLRHECGAPIFASYDLVHLWLDNFKSVVKPHVVLVEDKGELVGVAPLFTSHSRVMGLPLNFIGMVGNMNTLFGYSLYSVFAKQDDPAVIREMLSSIKKAKWNVLVMSKMEMNSSTSRFLDGLGKNGGSNPSSLSTSTDRSYVFPPEGNITADFGKSTRRHLQNMRNRLEKEGRMGLHKVENVEDAERAMNLYLSNHEQQWDHGISHLNTALNRRLLVEMGKLAVGKGMGEINELLIDGEVAGQVLCFFDGDVSRGFRVGMTDKFQDFSPGKLALILNMEENRKRGMKAMDFLHGNEDYKVHMTNMQHPLGSAMVNKGTWRAISRVRSLPAMRFLENRLKFHDRIEGRLYERKAGMDL